jgi:hypothetical protein
MIYTMLGNGISHLEPYLIYFSLRIPSLAIYNFPLREKKRPMLVLVVFNIYINYFYVTCFTLFEA